MALMMWLLFVVVATNYRPKVICFTVFPYFAIIRIMTSITHQVSKVQDNESAVGHAGFAEVRVRLAGQVLIVQLPHPALI